MWEHQVWVRFRERLDHNRSSSSSKAVIQTRHQLEGRLGREGELQSVSRSGSNGGRRRYHYSHTLCCLGDTFFQWLINYLRSDIMENIEFESLSMASMPTHSWRCFRTENGLKKQFHEHKKKNHKLWKWVEMTQLFSESDLSLNVLNFRWQ